MNTIAAASNIKGTPTPIPTPRPTFAELLNPDELIIADDDAAVVAVAVVADAVVLGLGLLVMDALDDGTEAVDTASPE